MSSSIGLGDVCYDNVNKEYVCVSNLICVKDHSNPEAFQQSHGPNGMMNCECVPCECIALRIVGLKNNRVITAWTYRKCESKNLTPVTSIDRDDFQRMMYGGDYTDKLYNAGRV